MSIFRVGLLSLGIGFAAASNALTIYTNYATFASATGALTSIDFDSATGPVTVLSGVTFTGIGNANIRSTARSYALSSPNILDVNEHTTAGGIGVIMTLPSAQGAFGFFYYDSEFSNSVTISQGNTPTTFALQNNSPLVWRFFGVTSTANDITSARLDVDPSDYLPVDNVVFGAVPEPGTGLALLGLFGMLKAYRRKK